MDEIFSSYFEAADNVAALLEDAQTAKRWDDPSALRGMSVGGLAAHLMQGVALIHHLLDGPEDTTGAVRVGLAEYTASFKVDDFEADIHRYLRRKAEHSATYGPKRTSERFSDLVAALRDRLQTESTRRILDLRPTLPWRISLEDRLRLNMMDLVVHADDLAISLGRKSGESPERASSVAIETLMAAARFAHGDLAVIRAMSRRERSEAEVFPVL